MRWLDHLLNDEPPSAAHSGTSHDGSPRRPRVLLRLNSLKNLYEKFVRHVGPPTLFQAIFLILHGFQIKFLTWMMGLSVFIVWPLIEECMFSTEISCWGRKLNLFLVSFWMGQMGYQLLLLVKEIKNKNSRLLVVTMFIKISNMLILITS